MVNDGRHPDAFTALIKPVGTTVCFSGVMQTGADANSHTHSEALEAVGTLQWLADGQHVVYSRVGALATPTEAWLHRVGTPEALDRLLYEEVRFPSPLPLCFITSTEISAALPPVLSRMEPVGAVSTHIQHSEVRFTRLTAGVRLTRLQQKQQQRRLSLGLRVRPLGRGAFVRGPVVALQAEQAESLEPQLLRRSSVRPPNGAPACGGALTMAEGCSRGSCPHCHFAA